MKLQLGQKGAKWRQQRGLGLRLDSELKPGQRQKATHTSAHCVPSVALSCVPCLFLRTICKGDVLIPTLQNRQLRLRVVKNTLKRTLLVSGIKKAKLHTSLYASGIRTKRTIKGQKNIFKAVFWISCIVYINWGVRSYTQSPGALNKHSKI